MSQDLAERQEVMRQLYRKGAGTTICEKKMDGGHALMRREQSLSSTSRGNMMDNNFRIKLIIAEQVENLGGHVKGRGEYLKYLNGTTITRNQAIVAKCYDCMGWFADGRQDCMIVTCPIYPYRAVKTKKDE